MYRKTRTYRRRFLVLEPYPEGTRVVKIRAKEGDGHQNGAKAFVISAVGPIKQDTLLKDGDFIPAGTYGYFVKWDDFPFPVFIAGNRLQADVYEPN